MPNQIPASYTVNVNIVIKDAVATVGDFGAAIFVGVSNVIPPSERIRLYSDSTAVLDDFGAEAEETLAAQTFFAQNPNPGYMYIGRWIDEAVAGYLKTTRPAADITTVTAVTDGSFSIAIDGTMQKDIVDVDLTSAITWDDVASILQTEMRTQFPEGGYEDCTVEAVISGGSTTFVITSGTTGATSVVQQATPYSSGTDLAALLGWDSGTPVYGADEETPVEALAAISAVNDNYYGIGFTAIVRDTSNTIDIAEYVESQNGQGSMTAKIFGAVSNDPECYNAASTTDMLSQLQDLGLARTYATYHNDEQYYPEMSLLANMLSIDFNGTNTVKDADFKPLPGIPAVPLTLSQLNTIVSKGGNTVIAQAGLIYYTPGNMASSRPFDITQDVDWLTSTIQLNALTYLATTAPKVPYTDGGAAGVEQNVRQSLQQGATNGMLATTNLDADGNVLPPFVTSVPLVSSIPVNQRVSRVGPPISFTAQLSGSIRKVTINGTVTI